MVSINEVTVRRARLVTEWLSHDKRHYSSELVCVSIIYEVATVHLYPIEWVLIYLQADKPSW